MPVMRHASNSTGGVYVPDVESRAPQVELTRSRSRRKPERIAGDDWTIQELARKHRLSESKVIDLYTGYGLMNIAAQGKRRCLRVPDVAVAAMQSRLSIQAEAET